MGEKMIINGVTVERLFPEELPIIYQPEFQHLFKRKPMPIPPLRMDVNDFCKLLVDHVDEHTLKEVMKQIDQAACDRDTDREQGKILKRMAIAIDDLRGE